jgi:hypothetical protein
LKEKKVLCCKRQAIELGPTTANHVAGPEAFSNYLLITLISIRRFLARPSSVLLSAIGRAVSGRSHRPSGDWAPLTFQRFAQ